MKTSLDHFLVESTTPDAIKRASVSLLSALRAEFTGTNIIIVDEPEHYKNKSGDGYGIRFLFADENANSVRINYEGSEIVSISVWSDNGGKYPSVNISNDDGADIESLSPLIIAQLSTPTTGTVEIADAHAEEDDAEEVEEVEEGGEVEEDGEAKEEIGEMAAGPITYKGAEYPSKGALVIALHKTGHFTNAQIARETAISSPFISKTVAAYKLTLTPGETEVNVDAVEGAVIAEGIQVQTLPVGQRFDDLRDLTVAVATGPLYSLVVHGMGGVGKTFTITDTLKKKGLATPSDYVYVSGASSAKALYLKLFYNKDKVVIFDDCDDVLKDKQATNVLKAALDSNDPRTVSWEGAKGGVNPDEYLLDMPTMINDAVAARVSAEDFTIDIGKQNNVVVNIFFDEKEIVDEKIEDIIAALSDEMGVDPSSLGADVTYTKVVKGKAAVKAKKKTAKNPAKPAVPAIAAVPATASINIGIRSIYTDEFYAELESGKVPFNFDFIGKVIFISNLSRFSMPQALLTRGPVIEITLTRDEVLERIKQLLDVIAPDSSMEDKIATLDMLEEDAQANVSIRSFLHALQMKSTKLENWKDLASRYCT